MSAGIAAIHSNADRKSLYLALLSFITAMEFSQVLTFSSIIYFTSLPSYPHS